VSKKTLNPKQIKEIKPVFFYLIILMVCFVLYGQSINNDFNIDDDYVYENHELVQKGFEGIPEIFTSRYNTRDEQYFGYRPLTIAIYAVEFEFFGSNPHSAHLFNILYYALACSLLFYFLNLIFKSKLPENSVWISFLISLVFATHAIHTEVVLSLKNREEIVSLIFGLLSVIWAIKFFDTKKFLWIIPSIASLALAFLAKESAIVFIILIPLTIIFFKTDIKFFSQFKIRNDSYLPRNLMEKALYGVLLLFIILFLFLINEFKFGLGLNVNFNSIDLGVNEFAAWGLFFITYLIIILIRKKSGTPVRLSKRNIILWISTLVLIILIPTIKSTIPGLLTFLTLFLTLKKEEHSPNQVFNVKFIENYNPKLLIFIASFLIISGLVLAFAYYIPKESLPETNAPVFKWQNPAFDHEASLSDKIAIALYSLIYYIKLMIIPFPLRFYYGYKMIPEVGIFNPVVLLSLAANLAMLIWSFRGFNRRNFMAFGFLFWFISIFPLANTFFPLTGIIAERLLFVPSIGFSILVVFLIFKITKTDFTVKLGRSSKILVFAIAMILILPNSIISISRNKDWKDRKTLYSHDIEYLENSAKANTLYGNLLIGEVYTAIKKNQPIIKYKPQIEQAIMYFNRSLEVDSTYSNPWHNLGYINMILYQNYELAEKQFTKCLDVDSTIAAAYLNRGISNFYVGNYKQSIIDFEDYLNKNQNYKDKELDKAYLFSGKSHLAMGDTAKCTEFYSKAVQNLKKQNLTPAVLTDIKNYFLSVQDFTNAITIVDLEISIDPNKDVGYVDKGNYYLLSGDTVKAIENWEIAFEKFKGNFNIAMTLSSYFMDKGNIEKADYYYNEAVKFRQQNPPK
jgi:tetratricopeptide (TPR) repeat protein